MRNAGLRNVAVVLAGGVGTRVGLGIPKQLIRVAGKAIVEHTLEVLNDHPRIDEVIVMMNAETIRELDHLQGDPRFPRLTRILPGGATRNDTAQLALEAIGDEECYVLFHDAVRPFIDHRIIDDCLTALETHDAVDTAISSADTIIEVDEGSTISDIPVRSRLRRGQTPQCFKASVIRRAYELAAKDDSFAATDDCGVVFTYLPDVPIYVVAGTAQNMKITEPLDIHIADKIFQLQTASVGGAADTDIPSLAGRNIVVFGASYGIGESVARVAREAGAHVHSFSRTGTQTDITSRKAVRSALMKAAASDPIDHVVVAAGILSISPLIEIKKKDLRKTIATNLTAPAKIAQEVFPYLSQTRGQLLFFTSSSYTRGRAGYSLYSATKAGIVNMTQALADEWSADGVRVNCVNPQRTETPMRTQAFGDEPPGTLLSPDDVARVCLRTLESSMTGQVVDVNLARPGM